MTDRVEILTRRRLVMLAIYGIMFLAFQSIVFTSLDAPVSDWRPVDWAKAAGFVGWSLTLIWVLASGGLVFRGWSPDVRAALNDELTQANRAFAYRVGYWTVLAVLMALFVLSQFFALERSEVLRLTFAIAVAMPACAFAGRERKQSGD